MLTADMAATPSYALAAVLPASAERAPAILPGPPAGEGASGVADISSVLFIGATVIFLAVAALIVVALFGPMSLRRRLSRPSLIVGAGIAFPVAALTALLVYVLSTASSMARAGATAATRIEVTGELWWWRVRYLDAAGKPVFETANDIRIPAGEWVEFVLKSDNVIHSFWIPELGGKLDMIPGHVNRLRVRALGAGRYTGQCAEYCGAQHANMKFDVQAMAPDAFQAWLSAQAQPAAPALSDAGPTLRQGARLFQQACAQCHTVRGTSAAGTQGPDLTHVGSRLSLAAGVLPNNVGALAGWIAGSQHIKPGNPMPSFDQLPGEDLRAVAHYLESLK
ncbi:cytochrome c oxidase subunit II [Achromobacter spanius]|uniref:cytochrome c oxidase subunit II n=1 Tax=Achromobacter spanius TaxID=217203 RepID=UPI003A9191F7